MIIFDLSEATEGKFQIGGQAVSGGSGDNAKVFFDNITLTQYSSLDDCLRDINGLTAATYANPIVTDFVVNGTFDSGITPWKRTGTYQNNQTANNQAGAFTGNFYENWNGTAQVNKMYQTITGIPNGTYRLDIAAFVNKLADPNESQYVFANDDKTYLTTGEPTAYEVYTVVTTNQIEIGLEQTTATANWMGIDNVSLRYYGAGDVINDAKNAAHKLAWEEAKAAAEAARDNASYANVTGSERTALLAEIAKAEPSTADDYDTATAALTTATQNFVNAKTNYDIFATYNTTLSYADSEKKPTITSESTAATILPALRAYYESNALAEGDATVIDYTSHLTNYNDPANTSGWTINNTTGNSNMRIMSSESYTDADDTNNHSYFDSNSWGSAFATTFTQNVTLPAGKYLFTAKARGNGTTTYKVIAGEEGTDITAIGNTGGVFDRGWNDYSVEFTVASEGAVTLGIQMETGSSSNWLSFGNFRLVKINNTLAEAADYTALNTAITAAEAKTLGFEYGEYAPYNNATALGKLAEAKAINQSANNEQNVVQGLTTYLNNASNWTANEGDVDAVYNGNFAIGQGSAAADIQQYGWTRTNGWGQFQNGAEGDNENGTVYYNQTGSLQYGNAGVYTMPLKAETVYELSFKYGAWDKNVTPTVSVLNAEDGMAAMSFAATSTSYKTSMNSVDMVFVTGAEGNYILTIAGNNNLVVTGVSITKAASQVLEFADGEVPAYAPGTYPQVKITRTLDSNRWYTAVYPFVVSGLDKIATLDSYSDDNMKFATATENTANEPFLMLSEAGLSNITLNNVVVAAANATNVEKGDASLIGTYTTVDKKNSSESTDKFYVISENMIRPVSTSSTATINPYRAYIKLANQSAGYARSLNFFVDEESTAIEGISAETANNDKFYNLNGQRVAAPTKGLYIVNGKKVVVK